MGEYKVRITVDIIVLAEDYEIAEIRAMEMLENALPDKKVFTEFTYGETEVLN
jgi:hypothetical protein